MKEQNLKAIGKWLLQFHDVLNDESLVDQCKDVKDCELYIEVRILQTCFTLLTAEKSQKVIKKHILYT